MNRVIPQTLRIIRYLTQKTPERKPAQRCVEETEVICVADTGDVAEERAGEAALGREDVGAGDVGCGWEATEETALEGEEGYDCGCEDCCCEDGGWLG